jgi:broad specificity phosphatase PhoE
MIGSYSHPPATAAVRLFSAVNAASRYECSPTAKLLHLVRHAEGTHNLCEKDSKRPIHLDAELTPKGVEQCLKLSSLTKDLNVEAVLVSPMTRCLQTATLSFPHVYGPIDNENKSGVSEKIERYNTHTNVPFIAYEEWRETVNYLCDSRRPVTTLQMEYPHVNFQYITHNHDPIWMQYEQIYGSHEDHDKRRESDDALGLYQRAHSAWKVLLNRPEKELALVGHSAFFMHMFTPLFEELEDVVRYEDEGVMELMGGERFYNCELRTVVVDFP